MIVSPPRLTWLAAFAAPLVLATASFAQPAAPPPPAAQPGGPTAHHWDPAQMRAHMAERLRAELQLQPSQEGALQAFLDAMKPPEGMRDRMRQEHQQGEQLSTPERLDRMLAKMDQRRARFAQMAAATKQFYAALSPSQQKAFDAMHVGHGMRGGHRRRGGGWGGHDRGPGGGPHEMGPDGQPHG